MNQQKVIKRYFTKDKKPEQSVFDMFEWKTVDVEIKNETTGATVFEMKDCRFPEHYSQTACEIIASKYFYRGIPETGLDDVVARMVHFWVLQLENEGLVKTDEEREILYDELVYSLLSQLWAPNSPQWFNTGLGFVGVNGDADDLYYFDEWTKRPVLSKDRYTRTQASACFILDIKDQLLGPGSISDHYVNETKLFKGGSGVGTNFSTLRAAGEHLSSGGTSSGLMSYLEGLDRNAGAIKSGGTTRRAAKMVIVDIDHPEIMEFVKWKAHEEKKAKVLMDAGYDGSIGGEAYNTVSGQNSNNSVRVNADFMKKLHEPGSTIELTGRVDDCVNKTVDVAELWDLIAQAAWECGDPAIQFDDTYNEWNTCAESGRINATNPCSEYAFLDNTACNLASINVYKFWDAENEKFDVAGYIHLIGIVQLVLEASIAGGQFPTPEVAENSYKYRTTGLGLTNLASLLLALEIPYDSVAGRKAAALLCSLMTGWSYVVSAGMAKEIGPFSMWEKNKESMKRVIQKHRENAENDDLMPIDVPELGDVGREQRKAWSLAESAADHGFRNAQVSVMAPTGTISFAMDCGSTGIEPFYSHNLFKKCADGSFITVKNPLAQEYLKKYYSNYDDYYGVYDNSLLNEINEYFDKHGTYRGCSELDDDDTNVLATAMEITPEGHVMMMAAIQPFISGSISKTVNLPNDATTDDIKRIYELAYETGCKSIALYRDGSKGVQPLADKQTDDDEPEIESKHSKTEDVKHPIIDRFESEHPGIPSGMKRYQNGEWQMYPHGDFIKYVREEEKEARQPKKPEGIRNSRTHSAKIGDVELYITVGYYPDGNMAELFVSTDRDGTVVKGLLTCLSKAISHLLQNHVKPEEISKMLRGQKFEPSGPVSRHPNIKFAESIADLISKVIDIECGDYSKCQVKPETVYLDDVPLPDRPPTFHIKRIGDLTSVDDDISEKMKASERHYARIKHPVSGKADIEIPDDSERIYGERCPECGSDRLVKSGTCKTCLVCGATTGCA